MTNPGKAAQFNLPLLEVIAITPEDAVAAAHGGADRLEVVREIGAGGLAPELDQFQRIRDAVDLPLRVMLRTNAGFRISPRELASLTTNTEDLRRAGADQFVFGFLDDSDELDLVALSATLEATGPCAWTLHHAFDYAARPEHAWDLASGLPGLDCVLTGGVRGDLNLGLATVCERARWQTSGVRWLAGGGLVPAFVAPLREAGIGMFHIGRSARAGNSWDQPASADAVRQWRQRLDTFGT